MCEECWIGTAQPCKPISSAFGPIAEPLELAARPADDIGIDPRQGWTQLRVIESAVVVYPAANARIVHRRQVLQGFVAATMKCPAPDCSADGLQCHWTRRRHEAVRVDPPLPDSFPRSEWVSRPAGFHHRPLAEPSVRLSPHSAPIRQTCRSYRAANVRKDSRFPGQAFRESDPRGSCELQSA